MLSATTVDNSSADVDSSQVVIDTSSAPMISSADAEDGMANPDAVGTATPQGWTPNDIRAAYGFDKITLPNGVVADGTGITVAVVIGDDYPTTWSDLQAFDQQFGLPDPPSFLRLASDGSTNYTTAQNPNGPREVDMDTQWIHAMAPGANIIVVEGNSQSQADMDRAMQFAESLPQVSVVSVSSNFANEFATEANYDVDFTTPTDHQGVTLVGSSGDNGDPGAYKAYSPNVVAVGGTVLTRNSDGTFSETGWSGSGGGVSVYEPQPSYQNGVVSAYSTTNRTNPDVAMPAQSSSVYDPTDFGASTPWHEGGGTSWSAPLFASLMAIIDQARFEAGLGTLDGGTQTLPMLYSHPNDFNDITTGNNNSPAGVGYDLVTGLGSPIANKLVPDMVRTTGMSAIASTPANGALVSPSTTDFSVYFSDTYDPATVQASDLTIDHVAADSFTLTSATEITFHFSRSPLTSDGAHTLDIAQGSIARLDGAPIAAYEATFATSTSPVVSVPATQVTSENQAVQFYIGADNLVQLTEAYDPGGDKQLTLMTSQGTLSLGSTNQLSSMSGNGTSTIIMTGSVAVLNDALVGLAFTPTSGFVGNAVLQVSADDLGHNGTGQSRTDEKTIVIQVRPTPAASLVSDINSGTASSAPSNLLAVGNVVYFSATDATHGAELWKSDGTAAGTMLVADINSGTASSSPTNLTYFNGYVYFAATDTVHGTELWRTDGTSAGTTLVRDINPNASSSSPTNLTVVGNYLFFTANDGTHGTELWETDGTPTGTLLVKDIDAGSASSSPSSLVNMNGTLFFAATDGVTGKELWSSDGTAAGTTAVADILAGSSSSSPTSLTVVNNTLFFVATDSTDGKELWKWNSVGGVALVADIYPGATSGTPNSSSPALLTAVGNELYFTATDGLHGIELWKSDGTAAGTQLVCNVGDGNGSAAISSVVNVNGVVYFSAADGSHSTELWKTDGTPAGTALVDDIRPGGNSSTPANFTAANGVLYLTANDGTNGTQLWQSDGELVNTYLAANISNGVSGSSPNGLTTTSSGALFFTATDAAHGSELWMIPGNAAPTTSGLATINVIEGATSSNVSLAASFSDDNDQSSGILYTVTSDTNSAIFSNITIDPNTGNLILNYASKHSGSATLTVRATDSSGAFVETSLNVTVDAPPTVMGVYVSGGDKWDSSYYDGLDSSGLGNSTITGLGYNVSNGADQLVSLPWLNLNTINILFSEDVNVAQSSLQIIGSATPGAPTAPTPTGFSYNASSHVATWTFASPLVGDRILLHFDASNVTDAAGAMLDGYWQDGVSSSIAGSGDGAQGSDFNFMAYVLPGDQLNQQTVTLADAKQIVPYINLSVGNTGYNYRMDVLGQGTITLADAKQIVPLINSDISGLDDPTAPAPSDAETQTSDDDSDFTVAAAPGFATIINLSSDPVVLSADQRLVAVDNALELVVSPRIAPGETTMPLYQDANASTSEAVTLPPPSMIDRTAVIDHMFSDGVDWMPSSTLPVSPVALNSGVSLALSPAAPTTGPLSQPPAAVPVATARIGGVGRAALAEEMAEILGETQETWRFATAEQSGLANRPTNVL